jgi:type IV pilus assembly protein PilM
VDGTEEHHEHEWGQEETEAGENGHRTIRAISSENISGNRKHFRKSEDKAVGMFGFGSSKAIVGLDIGSSCIKAIELKRSKGSIQVLHFGLEPLASDIVVDSMIVDSGSVSSAISKIFAEHGIKARSVATSVSGHSVIVKKIPVQPMSEAELADSITTEAAQHIPFDIADVNVDFDILNPDEQGPHMDVLLVAVKKDKILNYTNVLSLAGKSPAVVDIDAFALQNCYEYNYQPAHDSTVALLNLGASVMNINIVKGTSPLFTRDVSVGGNQYTDSLQKELDLSFDDAESLKLGRKVGTVSEDAKLPILQQVTEIIVLEIQKTFDFFRATASGEHIERIYLAGGSSKVPGLVEALRHEFSLPVDILNPFQRILPPADANENAILEQNPGQLAVAVGLALRSFENL